LISGGLTPSESVQAHRGCHRLFGGCRIAGGKYTIQANGKIVGRGDGHITGGTGLYRGLTGTLAFTAAQER
jgi:hypothetical protein